jgi:hypothetical protein
MVKVLQNLHKALVVSGAIVMSMCRGNWEGYDERPTGKRYTAGWEYHTLAPCLEQAGFAIVNHYYRPPRLTARSSILGSNGGQKNLT